MASSWTGSSLWIRAWLGAVARPAWGRAGAVWGALALVAAVSMGPTALTPDVLFAVLSQDVVTAAVAVALWLLLLHPAARVLMRTEADGFLRSLPAPRGARLLPVAMLTAAHAPALALLGFEASPLGGIGGGAAIVGASALIALAPLGERARPAPAWPSAARALRSLLWARLRADEALGRACGFALLAGGGAGLVLANSGLGGSSAATAGLAALALLGAPAQAAIIVPLATVHRRLWPLCATSGVPFSTAWAAALLVHAAAASALVTLAAVAATLLAALPLTSAARFCAEAVVVGAALGVGGAAVGSWATARTMVAERVVLGALCLGAVTAALLGALGEVGILATAAAATVVALRATEPALC